MLNTQQIHQLLTMHMIISFATLWIFQWIQTCVRQNECNSPILTYGTYCFMIPTVEFDDIWRQCLYKQPVTQCLISKNETWCWGLNTKILEDKNTRTLCISHVNFKCFMLYRKYHFDIFPWKYKIYHNPLRSKISWSLFLLNQPTLTTVSPNKKGNSSFLYTGNKIITYFLS